MIRDLTQILHFPKTPQVRNGNEMYENKARYRSTQTNIVKIGGAISAHATIKAEYLFTVARTHDGLMSTIKLEDSIYDFHTRGSEKLAKIVHATDTIKEQIMYQLDDGGTPISLLNFEDIQERWRDFRRRMSDEGLLGELSKDDLHRFTVAGDTEYNSREILLHNSNMSLFNKITLSQYLTKKPEDFEVEVYKTQSHFFPQIAFDVCCETEEKKVGPESILFAKTGMPVFVDKSKMIALYEEMYKDQVQFKFTDYKYEVMIHFDVARRDSFIMAAEARITEKIKNNLESEVIYQLKQVEL